jgi:hypothetical protein
MVNLILSKMINIKLKLNGKKEYSVFNVWLLTGNPYGVETL